MVSNVLTAVLISILSVAWKWGSTDLERGFAVAMASVVAVYLGLRLVDSAEHAGLFLLGSINVVCAAWLLHSVRQSLSGSDGLLQSTPLTVESPRLQLMMCVVTFLFGVICRSQPVAPRARARYFACAHSMTGAKFTVIVARTSSVADASLQRAFRLFIMWLCAVAGWGLVQVMCRRYAKPTPEHDAETACGSIVPSASARIRFRFRSSEDPPPRLALPGLGDSEKQQFLRKPARHLLVYVLFAAVLYAVLSLAEAMRLLPEDTRDQS